MEIICYYIEQLLWLRMPAFRHCYVDNVEGMVSGTHYSSTLKGLLNSEF